MKRLDPDFGRWVWSTTIFSRFPSSFAREISLFFAFLVSPLSRYFAKRAKIRQQFSKTNLEEELSFCFRFLWVWLYSPWCSSIYENYLTLPLTMPSNYSYWKSGIKITTFSFSKKLAVSIYSFSFWKYEVIKEKVTLFPSFFIASAHCGLR